MYIQKFPLGKYSGSFCIYERASTGCSDSDRNTLNIFEKFSRNENVEDCRGGKNADVSFCFLSLSHFFFVCLRDSRSSTFILRVVKKIFLRLRIRAKARRRKKIGKYKRELNYRSVLRVSIRVILSYLACMNF